MKAKTGSLARNKSVKSEHQEETRGLTAGISVMAYKGEKKGTGLYCLQSFTLSAMEMSGCFVWVDGQTAGSGRECASSH